MSCTCNSAKPDKDYFQSTQEEYTKGPVISSTEWRITEECNELRDLLVSKNRKYGDSALDLGVFNISPVIAIKARIQDKLNRLKNDNKDEDEDIVLDLLGYFILLRIAIKEERENKDV